MDVGNVYLYNPGRDTIICVSTFYNKINFLPATPQLSYQQLLYDQD